MIGKLILLIACGWFAGCAAVGMESLFTSEEEGRFFLSADKSGIEAFGRAMNGLVTTGKAKRNVEDSYWKHQNNVVTFRALSQGQQPAREGE